METSTPTRFPIRFDPAYGALSSALFLRPSDSYLDIDGDSVNVRMAWGFRTRFDRRAVVSTEELAKKPLSRGVHGFAGRWLVNGSGEGILVIRLEPPQRAWVMGFPVRLREIMISVWEPAGLAEALRPPHGLYCPANKGPEVLNGTLEGVFRHWVPGGFGRRRRPPRRF